MVARKATASGFVLPEKGIGGGRGMNSGGGGVGFFGPVSLGFCGGAAVTGGLPDLAVFNKSAIWSAFATSVASSYTTLYENFVWQRSNITTSTHLLEAGSAHRRIAL